MRLPAPAQLDYRELFEAAPDPLLVIAPDFTIVGASDAYARATKMVRERIVGCSIFEVFPGNPAASAADGLRASLERVLHLRRQDFMGLQTHDVRRPAREGGGFEQRYWRPVNSPVLDANSEVAWIVHRLIDVTELVRLEAGGAAQARLTLEQHRVIERQLIHAQKMEAIGALTGGMAHDFNNLLGIIIGNLDLLSEAPGIRDVSEADDLVGGAIAAAVRGADLTRRLLAFARRQPLQPEPVDVNTLLEDVSKLLARALGEDVAVSLDLGTDLWTVVVDPAQLEASLTNLANNARDAMPKGGSLTLRTRNRRLDDDYASEHADAVPGDYVMIEVSDTGTGMPPAIQSCIFEPFFTTKAEGKGTGLGLSMVFGFMKQSNGHINVYSEVGVGTTFRLYLPRGTAPAEAAEKTPDAPAIRALGETVLAVEDNSRLRRLVVRQLGELGYRVLEAENARAAIDLLERERVDLLFTDIVMPGGLDGYDLARRALARRPELKVVLTSGFPTVRPNGGQAAPTNLRLLSKPYRKVDLGHVLREVLDR